MLARCLALVADEPRLSSGVALHLTRTVGESGQIFRFDAVRERLGPDAEGLLVLIAGSDAELRQALRLAQEVRLLDWPAQSVLVLAEAAKLAPEASGLDGQGIEVVRWPEESSRLTGLAKQADHRGRGFARPGKESVEETISRRLLCWTPSLAPMAERIALAAAHEVTVLLTGETGTGKTHLARLVHDFSPRREHRFLAVPCGAIAANLVESEFFGHVKGAFTGADRPKIGKFAAAGEGTILLDEIDALQLEHQANLLRVIETGEYEPVGATDTELCKARIIVASNWNLVEAVEQGKFRSDLYYRLNVMSFHLPPLRERVQDIPPLVRGMAVRYAEKFRKALFDIHPEAMTALQAYPWPGNIRQLENAVQQAVLVSTGPELLVQNLPVAVRTNAGQPSTLSQAPAESLMHNRELAERSVIQKALMTNSYSRARAASALGISRVTLYKKMKKYGLMDVPVAQVS